MQHQHIGTALRRARAVFLASTTLWAMPMAAHAQADVRPGSWVDEPEIVISQPGTPGSAVDPNDITGVGQMIIDQKNGFLGLCTGTLINPRTVIFAAHCVNESPAGTAMNPWNYGTGAGQLPIGFGFKANNLPGVRAWYLAGANQYQTSTANAFYNVNQVVYNADSLKLGLANNFYQADVALATLDTPAKNIPTWTILLSALPAPASLNDTTGTGYHVVESGYGTNGIGTTGAVGGIDYRRRVAENFIGILGSIDDTSLFLFGTTRGLPQNLYQLDFDDPRRGTASASPYDFNPFKDKALPNEGITGPGDSGGPLILDKAFAKPTVIGVLSGGTRYYGAQPSGAYGTTSFYQPLYLFWDYIAANNPYRYVSAVAGDGKWSDPTHWVTNLDPAYQIVSGGQLVNGVPTTPGAGIAGDANKFGAVCFDSRTISDCVDLKTNIETIKPVGTSDTQTPASTGGATAGAEIAAQDSGGTVKVAASSLQDQASAGTSGTGNSAAAAAVAALPAATLANGLPGATGFVPNNIDPNAALQRSARYFDVTLSAAGTTTLDTSATVDRFTISGSASKLNVTSTGSLTSLMEVNHLGGLITVDGTLTTLGDYFMLSGGLAGAGRINAPFFTNVAGMIAPGGVGATGTLTFGGNVILASNSQLLMDVGANGTSDRIAAVANGTATGQVNVGGSVGFAPVSGYIIRDGDLYTIVTAAGGVTGTFKAPTALSAILTPQFIYSANAVQARIVAGLYANVVANTPVQTAYAALLDRNRSNYAALSGLYGPLDIQNASTIQATLEGLAPRAESLRRAIGSVALDNMARFYRNRLAAIDTASTPGGTLTMIGQPVQLAANAVAGLPTQTATMSDSAAISVRENALPENVSVYVAGGYLDASAAPMPTAIPQGGRDHFDGWYAAGGIEAQAGDNAVIGFGLSYTRADGSTAVQGQRVVGELYQGTLYGKTESPSGLYLDTQASAGLFRADTRRTVNFVGSTYTLRARDNALALSGEVGAGANYNAGSLKIGPRVAVRTSYIGFTPTAETGGPAALRTDRANVVSVQGRAGLQLSGGTTIRPYAAAYYVHDFKNQPGSFGANFAGGIGPSALFALPGQDKNWAEASAGLAADVGNLTVSISADTTIERNDVRNQAYRAGLKLSF